MKIAAKARARNVKTKRTTREALKAFAKAVEGGKAAEIQAAQREAVSAIDIAVKKAIIHKNRAARQKSALAAQAKAAGVKQPATSDKQKAKRPPAKKTTAKKPSSQKTTKK